MHYPDVPRILVCVPLFQLWNSHPHLDPLRILHPQRPSCLGIQGPRESHRWELHSWKTLMTLLVQLKTVLYIIRLVCDEINCILSVRNIFRKMI
eukprot:SAG31_NODE_871_length_11335_cov_4.910822_9_plen_94_part_00